MFFSLLFGTSLYSKPLDTFPGLYILGSMTLYLSSIYSRPPDTRPDVEPSARLPAGGGPLHLRSPRLPC